MIELRPIGTRFTLKGSSYNQDKSYGDHAINKFNEEEHALNFVIVDHGIDSFGVPYEIAKEIDEDQCHLCSGYHGDNSHCQRSA